jgi:hypothetical protein
MLTPYRAIGPGLVLDVGVLGGLDRLAGVDVGNLQSGVRIHRGAEGSLVSEVCLSCLGIRADGTAVLTLTSADTQARRARLRMERRMRAMVA